MVSFYSSEMISKCLKTIPSEFKIIIVNNAINDPIQNKIRASKNMLILTPSKNLGNGGGFNYGLRRCKTPYILYLDVDTKLEKNTLKDLIKLSKKRDDWGIIAPNIKNYKYKKKFIKKDLDKNFYEMSFVEGCALLFNYKKVKKLGFYDSKIFLYYEEDDIFHKYIKNKKKILLSKNVLIKHIGNSSVNKKYYYEIELNRNWHLMWSKFYYLQKNFSYLFGLRKTFKSFLTSLIKFFVFFLINQKKSQIYYNRFEGLLTSYLKRSSWRRPNIK